MKAEYLELSNGEKVRVEWNMNSMGAFVQETGIEMTDLAKGKADILMLRKVAWFMAVEGESIEGRTFTMTEVEMGRMITQNGVIALANIFARQARTEEQKKSPPERSPRIFFRRRG